MIELNDEQTEVNNIIIEKLQMSNHDKPSFCRSPFNYIIGGYAGTGKTTLLAYLRNEIYKSFPMITVAFATFTGKASSVLKSKLDSNGIDTSRDYVGTIHSLIYKPVTKWDKQLKCFVITGWTLKDPDAEVFYDIIIIDEGSMVSQQLWDDLLKMGRTMIVMGDHGQLPPVGDSFSLMKDTDYKLTKIHRQALNSPIIQMSQFVRDYGYIPSNRIFSNEVFKLSWKDPRCKNLWENISIDENLIVLCAFNATRVSLNDRIRKMLNYQVDDLIPGPNERIVCLQNDRNRGIMNGQIGTVLWLMPENHDLYRITIAVDEFPDPIECAVSKECFGQVTYTTYDKSKKKKKQMDYVSDKGISPVNYFDFGYAMSVHKSQGSEWDRVILFEQRTKHWDDEYYGRWLYTAITRAREKLFIISDYWG
jgi:exodeoxyribonuclease-5